MAQGLNLLWGEIFSACPDWPGAHPSSYTMGTGSFPGVKQPWHGVDHPSASSAEVKERVGYVWCGGVCMCGCFDNCMGVLVRVCTCICCVFVLFRLCIFILICFVCTSVRTTATE